MAKTLSEAGKKLHVTEIVKHGEKMIVPEGMTLAQAKELIERRMEYEQQVASFIETFDAFPWDGAYALWQVLGQKYGWASGLPTPGFFGDKPPVMVTIDSGPDTTVQIPWGRVAIPGVDGFLDLGTSWKGSRIIFQIAVTTKRKNEPDVKAICLAVREYLRDHSLYKGKAIKIRFRDDKGELQGMPEPKFLDVTGIGPQDLIYSRLVTEAIETNVFTPLTRLEDCSEAGIDFKRGVLLAGDFGTGKTLAMRVAAYLATQNGVTYVYCGRADELAYAVEFAVQYSHGQGAAVACEDIDRVLTGERSFSMDELLNVIDGLDSKRTKVMVILTTNAVENINPAMIRPGRLDAVIEVIKPDAEAVERLLRHYGKGVIDEYADLSEVSKTLAGNIPAVIAEVVKRSKLSALKRTPKGTSEVTVDADSLQEAADTMEMQLRLLKGKAAPVSHPADPLIEHVGNLIDTKMTNGINKVVEGQVRKLLKQMQDGNL